MTDDLDDIRKALDAAPPPKAQSAMQTRAMASAMEAFDTAPAAAEEKTSTDLQGSRSAVRQKGRQSGLMPLLRRFTMNMTLPSTRTMMMGGASLAVLTLAVVTTQHLRQEPLPLVDAALQSSLDGAPVGGAELRQEAPLDRQGMPADALQRLDGVTLVPPPAPSTEIAPSADAGGSGQTVGRTNGVPLSKREMPPAPEVQVSPSLSEASPSMAPGAEVTIRQRHAAPSRLSVLPAVRVAPSDTAPLLETDREAPALPLYEDTGRDQFEEIEPNQIKLAAEEPVSTFSIDVDTASYSFMRAAVTNGVLPQKNAVRIEELINYFPYDYAGPESRETPFRANVAVMPTPWNEGTRLMRIGIKGYDLTPDEKPRSNLVFLLDTSGSMNAPNKLPLLINSFRMLVDSLDPEDTVSIVVYAGSAGTVLEPTRVSEKSKVLGALQRLRAGGSTAGGEGIRQAYQLAEASFDKDGVNRVILATDGDFNVGIQNREELSSFIERKRESGVFLSVLGFGRGNYNDALMQTLAQNGNGQAAYIDTLSEARKVLVEEASSALFPIAKDVKIQVEFNPATIAEYRLIGYETRLLSREDFNNDAIDAGEIGSGHTVTALYEITPVASDARLVDTLRYGDADAAAPAGNASDEYAFVKIRYKQPDADESQLITQPVTPENEIDPTVSGAIEARFAASVAAFGQLLRGGRYTQQFSYEDVIDLANGARGDDPFGYRAEFVNLVRLARSAAALEPQRR
ncbi:MAG: von Willebrand factor type A domain-containing protein [Pseudomonadota bacterium]